MSRAGLVLAAGEGRRFGGAKQLAMLRGRPMLAHVVDAAREVLDPLVVVLGAHADEILAEIPGLPAVRCADWADGQSASLRAGVEALAGCDEIVVLVGDQPGITSEVLRAIPELGGFDAVRASYDGVPGHPVLLGPRVLAEIPSLRGDAGARDLLRRFRVRDWEAGHLADPTDVDTPEQLEALP